MKVGIMQPYFLPYIGYWQLMNYVDAFVVYDNIQYTKKGWINRNRYLCNGSDRYFTIPLKKDSDFLNVNERYISETYDRKKLYKQFEAAYSKSPYFKDIEPLLTQIIHCQEKNLFEYIFCSIKQIKEILGISTPLFISSELDIDFSLRGKEKIQEICKCMQADVYVNPIGGVELYDKCDFEKKGIKLLFIQSELGKMEYKQFDNSFVPALSILDLLMFNSVSQVKDMLHVYKIN